MHKNDPFPPLSSLDSPVLALHFVKGSMKHFGEKFQCLMLNMLNDYIHNTTTKWSVTKNYHPSKSKLLYD